MKNFKKVISAVIALALSASTLVSAASFTDVAKTAPYAEAIDVLSSLGIVNGYEDGTFKPEGEITRAEAATMIVGALNMTADAVAAAGTTQFADVNEKAAWASGYINVGVAQKFISGMGDGTFAPQANVTYAQMCVMLTIISGYGDYAANGGYPTGYTTMAATTGINKGVSVGDNTALTRGQVAQMIYNTLLTPMLGVDKYTFQGNEYAMLDGTDGKFKTLLSDKFDGYAATIRILETPVSDASTLENDEVNFEIIKADWWAEANGALKDDTTGRPTAFRDETEKFAEGVDVNGNLKKIGKAIFVHDEEGELLLVYFAETGKTATKEFVAEDYIPQAKLADANQYSSTNAKIRFGSKYYNVENSITVYVNGVAEASPITNAADNSGSTFAAPNLTTAQTALDNYLTNARGTITLLDDGTNPGYEVIFVEIWDVAEVYGVEYENGRTSISMFTKGYVGTQYDEIAIDDEYVEEGKVKVTVEKNGEVADLASLAKGDIIAYKSVINDGVDTILENPKEIEILATDSVASGKLSSVDGDEKIVIIDGTNYEMVAWGTLSSSDLAKSYELTLDPFGRIYKHVEDGSAALYAIALDLTTDEKAKLLLPDGTVKTYAVENDAYANFGSGNNNATYVDSYLNNTSTAANARVIEYKIKKSTGSINSFKLVTSFDDSNWGADVEYKGRTARLGTSPIVETTYVIDARSTLDGSDPRSASSYAKFDAKDFVDGTDYRYVSIRPSTSYTAFVVLSKIGTKFGANSRFAVVTKLGNLGETEDGDSVYKVEALVDGEKKEMLFDTDVYNDINNDGTTGDTLAVGDVFFYEVDGDGFVNKVFRIWNGSTFTTLYQAIAAVKGADQTTALDPDDFIITDEVKNGWNFNLANVSATYGGLTSVADSDIQLAMGYIVPGADGSMTFANIVSPLATINSNNDMTGTSDNGVAVFALDSDAVIYEYYAANPSALSESAKFTVKNNAVYGNNLTKYDANNDGVFNASEVTVSGVPATDMAGDAEKAIALIVDEVVVQVYVLK